MVINGGRFLNARSGPGDFTLSSGSLRQTGNYFIVGTNDRGTFTQNGGTVSATVDRGFFISDGTGGSSSLVVRDGDFTVEHNGTFNVDLHNTWIGRGASNDSVLIDGGNFSVSNTATGPSQRRFYLTRDATFQIDSGTALISDMRFVIVGRTREAGTSSFIVNGGQTQVGVNSAFVVGGGVNGTVSITGGTMDISRVDGAGGNLWIDDSGATTLASVTQSGGVLNVEGDIVIGRNAVGTTATYTMTGGELRAAALWVGSHPNPLFELLGGEIVLQGDQTGIVEEAWFTAAPGTTVMFDGDLNQTRISAREEGELNLLNFTYDEATGDSQVNLAGSPNSAYVLVRANDLDFASLDGSPVVLTSATIGSLDGNVITTDEDGLAEIQFNLGTTGSRSFIRAEVAP